MQFKSNNRYRRKSTQGLRSLGDSLPKIVRDKIIKKSDTYAKLLNNWDKLADNDSFELFWKDTIKEHVDQWSSLNTEIEFHLYEKKYLYLTN